MSAKSTFARIYREARVSGLHGRMEFYSGAGAEVFVSDTGHLSVGRQGRYESVPGTYAARLGRGTKTYRRYALELSRELGRVPLP